MTERVPEHLVSLIRDICRDLLSDRNSNSKTMKLVANKIILERSNVTVPSTSEKDPIVLGHQY